MIRRGMARLESLLLIGSLMLLASCRTHDGFVIMISGPDETVDSSLSREPLDNRKWKARVDSAVYADFIARDGSLFVTSSKPSLSEISIDTGRTVRRLISNDFDVFTAPAIADGMILFGAYNRYDPYQRGAVFALDRGTGEVIWGPSGPFGALWNPVVVGDLVYFGSGRDTLYVFDLRTGRPNWSFRRWLVGMPGSNASTLFVPSGNALYALQARTGRRLWAYDAGGEILTPVADAERVYLTSNPMRSGDTVRALDVRTGDLVWEYPILDWPIDLELAGQVLFVSNHSGEIVALDVQDGSLVWRVHKPPTRGNDGFGGVSLSASAVFVVWGDAYVLAFDARTGNELWVRQLPYGILASPQVYDDTVFVISGREIYALDARTGQIL